MTQPPRQTLLELDARRRISLGALATYDRYLVEVQDDGTIVLTPAVVIPASTSEAIERFLDDPESGQRRQRGSAKP